MPWLIEYVENMSDMSYNIWWHGLRTLPILLVMSNYDFSKKRIARKPFIYVTVGYLILSFVIGHQILNSHTTADSLVLSALLLVLWVIIIICTAYRLRDIGNSRWWLAMMALPYLNIGLILYGCFRRQDYVRDKLKQ